MVNLKEVELVSTGYYLPGEPIPFDQIDLVVGEFHSLSPLEKKRISKYKGMMKKILKGCSYLAIDPVSRKPLETITSLSVKAIKKALETADLKINEIEYIALGAPLPDYMTPPTTPFIQEELGIERCSEIEIHSNCTSMTKAMEVAQNALQVGKYKNAVVVYAQNPSSYLTRNFYNQDRLGIENMLLRWFLSDSAGAVVLKAADKVKTGIKLVGTYNESIGEKLKPSMWMYFGAANFNLKEVYEQGKHHFGQDYQLVNKLGPIIQVEGLKTMLNRLNLKGKEVDHLLISIPSYQLENEAKKKTAAEVGIAENKWFDNVGTKGYCGGASLITSLQELIEKGGFNTGERTLCFVTESSKWMVGGFLLERI